MLDNRVKRGVKTSLLITILIKCFYKTEKNKIIIVYYILSKNVRLFIETRWIICWYRGTKEISLNSAAASNFMWHVLLRENSFGVFCRQSFNEIGISTAVADGNRLFRDEIPNRISILNWPREMRVAQVTIRKKHTMSHSHSNLNLIILARGLRFWYSGSHSVRAVPYCHTPGVLFHKEKLLAINNLIN